MSWCIGCILLGHGPHAPDTEEIIDVRDDVAVCECKVKGFTHGRGERV